MTYSYIVGLCGLSSDVTEWTVHNTAIARAVQAMYRPFSRGGKLHHVRDFVPSWAVWRAVAV